MSDNPMTSFATTVSRPPHTSAVERIDFILDGVPKRKLISIH